MGQSTQQTELRYELLTDSKVTFITYCFLLRFMQVENVPLFALQTPTLTLLPSQLARRTAVGRAKSTAFLSVINTSSVME